MDASTPTISQLATADTGTTLASRIKSLLGRGLSGNIVASSVGCDPSYISQLMENEDFKREVLELRARGAEGAIERDGKWDSLEQKALSKMEEILPMVMRPADIIRIAQIANAAKRTARELANGGDTAGDVVKITLPASATVYLQMNAQSQVVQIDDRSTAPLPTSHLQKMLTDRRTVREEAGLVEIAVPRAVETERKKVVSILEQIGFADEAVPVVNVLATVKR